MPHVIIEYSANLEADIAPQRLVEAVHRAVVANPAFEIGAVRTRAARREHFMVADGDPDNAFVAVTMRIGPGRDARTRKQASEAIMMALSDALADVFPKRGLGLSVEVTELDDSGMTRKNNLHQRMRDRAAAG